MVFRIIIYGKIERLIKGRPCRYSNPSRLYGGDMPRVKMSNNNNSQRITVPTMLKFVLENVYDKPKLKTTKAVTSSAYGGEMPRVKMSSNNNNIQRIKSSDNAEIAGCLAPSSHPGLPSQTWLKVTGDSFSIS